MFKQKSTYASVKALFAADIKAPLVTSNFDDELWTLLCARIQQPADLVAMPIEVTHYYASRLVQWDVDNGGFSQAAYNVPEWFAPAAAGYDALGNPKAANLVRQASALIPEDPDDLEHFEEQFDGLTEKLDSVDWRMDDIRVAYVRAHREEFLSAVPS